jgi:hypothetical protein
MGNWFTVQREEEDEEEEEEEEEAVPLDEEHSVPV